MDITKRFVTLWFAFLLFISGACADSFIVNYSLNDSYGDGWTGAAVNVLDEDGNIVKQLTITNGNSNNGTLELNGSYFEFVWQKGKYDGECSCSFTDGNATTLYALGTGSNLNDGTVLFSLGKKPYPKPTALQATNIKATKALLSWEDNNSTDSYVLQYKTWNQVGNDVTVTNELTQYSFDLSQYSGTGSIAIRHFNVTDMFRIAVDDIVVTNADNEVIVNQDFENDMIPSGWINIDYDGDNNKWATVTFGTDGGVFQNGDYCVSSESWKSGAALTPDNWLIIPNVPLGGTLTFYARGVDNEYYQENFAVFVAPDNNAKEVTVEGKSYQANNLIANSMYIWQVKGISGSDESKWSTSMFSTLAVEKGDLDGDGEFTVNDVTMLVNIVLNKVTDYDFNTADVDGSNSIDVSDVTTLVNIILGKQ
ncbi:MAG: choice-of-anchor J domain-containing protein [Prevotella sp.]|nr:choice-of-anchor J domain-containing protein [Prevotella sp.]